MIDAANRPVEPSVDHPKVDKSQLSKLKDPHADRSGGKSRPASKKREKDLVIVSKVNAANKHKPHAGHHVNPEANRWPFCVVWTPIPFITWFVPIIGHTGVANAAGLIYDFSDDYDVSINNFTFGDPTKYYQFSYRAIEPAAWDAAIRETSKYYGKTKHSLFSNNCHQYISDILNKVKYLERDNWTQAHVCSLITFESTYTDLRGFVRQWVPFFLILVVSTIVLAIIF